MDNYLATGFIITASWYCAWANSHVLLHTDLINMIATDGNCSALAKTGNVSSYEKLEYATQSVELSRFSFSRMALSTGNQQKCEKEDVTMTHFFSYTWVCFSSGNGSKTLRDTNWFFLDCAAVKFISVSCLTNTTMYDIKNQLCGNVSLEDKCMAFTTDSDGKHQICSQNFAVRSKQAEDGNQKMPFLSSFDIVAILSAVFIITCFILAICIPAQRCKPTYRYEKEAERRVPLEIYEMYGASYMPSAKRQLTADTEHSKRRISRLAQHSRNVALVAIVEDDQALMKRQTKKHNSKHVTIMSDITHIDGQVKKRLNEDNVEELSARKLNDVQNGNSHHVHVRNMLDEYCTTKNSKGESMDRQSTVGTENSKNTDDVNNTFKRRSSTC